MPPMMEGIGSGGDAKPTTTSTTSTNTTNTGSRWKSFLFRLESVPDSDVRDELATVVSNSSSMPSLGSLASIVTTYYNATNSEKPKRLVDFFCVIGPRDTVVTASIVDCYPAKRENMEFPSHLPHFCFPNGYKASINSKPPALMTLVLTSGNGNRLYGSVLTFYEEAQGYQLKLFDESIRPKKRAKHQETVYLPKCLVVLSHYPYFDVFRTFLRQLYRIFQSGSSPLPLERYIATFVQDVPLPSLRCRVQWECFTKDTTIDFVRPAPNELPLVNFSYQPLFFTLSVSNMLVVWGTLLQEGQVVLCSKFHSLLTPVAEALLSLLFPMQWHGLYIPVLPSDTYDVLDAPIPYLLGIANPDFDMLRRPDGVVFVDLDNDIVHLGCDENWQAATMPILPDRDVLDLKVELEELVDHLYLVPSSGIKGRITSGNDNDTLDNSARETYSLMTRILDEKTAESTSHREFILSNAERAFFGEPEPLEEDDYAVIGQDEVTTTIENPLPSTTTKSPSAPAPTFTKAFRRQTRSIQAHTDRLLAYAGQTFATANPFVVDDQSLLDEKTRVSIATKFYDLDEDVDAEQLQSKGKQFSTQAVRKTFLDFFVNLLFNYKAFITTDKNGNSSFQLELFLKDKNISERNQPGVTTVLSTQMFERFIYESVQSSERRFPRICVFDEHILLKRNRSIWNGGGLLKKEPTPLLDSPRWKVRQIMTPPGACNAGIWSKSIYQYTSFPKLKENEFVYTANAGLWNCGSDALCSVLSCWPTVS